MLVGRDKDALREPAETSVKLCGIIEFCKRIGPFGIACAVGAAQPCDIQLFACEYLGGGGLFNHLHLFEVIAYFLDLSKRCAVAQRVNLLRHKVNRSFLYAV